MTDDEPKRSLWTQEMLDKLEGGPGYPHTFGPPSPPPDDSFTPAAELARQAVKNLGHLKSQMSEETETDVTIITPGRLAEPSEIPGPVALLLKKSGASGWDTRVGYSRFRTPDKTYKSGPRQGTTNTGKTVAFTWVIGRKGSKRFVARYHDGKFLEATWGPYAMVNSTILTKLVTGVLNEPPAKEYVEKIPDEKEYA